MTTDATGNEELLTEFSLSTAPPSAEGFGDSPLKKFKGRGTGYWVAGGRGKDKPGANGTVIQGNMWQRPHFQFTELEVIEMMEGAEPWNQPTADISIFYSAPEKSIRRRPGEGTNDWEAVCESIRGYGLEGMAAFNLLFGGRVSKEGEQPANKGLLMTWERLPTLIRVGPDMQAAEAAQQQGNLTEAQRLMKWHDDVKLAWRITEVEGKGGWQDPSPPQTVGAVTAGTPAGGSGVVATSSVPNVVDVLCGIADGKTEDQFYSAALDDATVAGNPAMITQIVGKTVVQTLTDMGKITKTEDGILHKS